MRSSLSLRTLILLGSLLVPAGFTINPLYAQRFICCPVTDTQNPASPVIPPPPEDASTPGEVNTLPYPGTDAVRDQRQSTPGIGANGQFIG